MACLWKSRQAGDEAAEGYSPFDDDAFGAIFDEGYSFESMEGVAKPTRKAGYSGQRAKASSQMVPGSVTSEAEDALRDGVRNYGRIPPGAGNADAAMREDAR